MFLDANVIIAAVASETGASRFLFQIAEFDSSIQLLTSTYALKEAKKNVEVKMKEKKNIFSSLVTLKSLTVVEKAPKALHEVAAFVIREKDVPILASAIFAQVDYLCTLDQEDFHVKKVQNFVKQFDIKICFPGDIVKEWRKNFKK